MDVIHVPAGSLALAAQLALATLLGAAIGFNREMSQRPAGLRTHALVSLGAALSTYIGLQLAVAGDGDPAAASRIIQGLVAGVGFIGGGVILHRPDAETVKGLTTAATIWIVAATGIAVGAGLWRAALITVGLSLLVLTVGRRVDGAVHEVSSGGQDE